MLLYVLYLIIRLINRDTIILTSQIIIRVGSFDGCGGGSSSIVVVVAVDVT
jgi:hypothetical protein